MDIWFSVLQFCNTRDLGMTTCVSKQHKSCVRHYDNQLWCNIVVRSWRLENIPICFDFKILDVNKNDQVIPQLWQTMYSMFNNIQLDTNELKALISEKILLAIGNTLREQSKLLKSQGRWQLLQCDFDFEPGGDRKEWHSHWMVERANDMWLFNLRNNATTDSSDPSMWEYQLSLNRDVFDDTENYTCHMLLLAFAPHKKVHATTTMAMTSASLTMNGNQRTTKVPLCIGTELTTVMNHSDDKIWVFVQENY